MKVYADFDRANLRLTFAEVKALVPQAKARDVGAVRSHGDQWFAEVNRPCYGGHFWINCTASTAWHAKQQLWAAWLKKNGDGKKAEKKA